MTTLDQRADRGLVLDEAEVELLRRLLGAFRIPGVLAAEDRPVLDGLVQRLS